MKPLFSLLPLFCFKSFDPKSILLYEFNHYKESCEYESTQKWNSIRYSSSPTPFDETWQREINSAFLNKRRKTVCTTPEAELHYLKLFEICFSFFVYNSQFNIKFIIPFILNLSGSSSKISTERYWLKNTNYDSSLCGLLNLISIASVNKKCNY